MKHTMARIGAGIFLAAALTVTVALPAAAATSGYNGPADTIAPGGNGRLVLGIVGPAAASPALTSTLSMTWNAPANATFTDAGVDYHQASGGSSYETSYKSTFNNGECALSGDKKTLTCTLPVTVPATAPNAQGQYPPSYVWLKPHITVDPSAPPLSTFASSVTWTSNNGQVSSGSATPEYKTSAVVPTPLADPLVAGGVGVIAAAAVGAVTWSRHRRATAA